MFDLRVSNSDLRAIHKYLLKYDPSKPETLARVLSVLSGYIWIVMADSSEEEIQKLEDFMHSSDSDVDIVNVSFSEMELGMYNQV